MNRYPHAPLTPEERELAERLARLGPHDGPPPELDAKILAAAHDAVHARPARRRRRWLGLSAGAGGLVTGLGFAASLTLVLGVVWQMRPMETVYVSDPAADTAEHVILVDALPSAEPAHRPVPAPPTLPASPAQAPAMPQSRESADAVAAPPATQPELAAAKMASPEAPEQELEARAAQEANARAEQQARRQAANAGQERREAEDAAAAQARVASRQSIQQEPGDDAAAAPKARRATYTGAARATPERVERPLRPVGSAPAFAPEPAPASDADPAAQADSTELDSIVVTGSRVSPVTTIPLHEDAALGVADWLERIRARRDAGDIEDARESLSRFRRAHPRVDLPEDLAELARGDVPGNGTP